MTTNLNSYLEYLAEKAIIRDKEKSKIRISIDNLESRLENSLDHLIQEKFVFGSFSRGTILPRYMDTNSDIDYLVVFKTENKNYDIYRPQTYLNWLRCFTENNYSSSEIHQSIPTVVLSLNHIHFELVPAINSLFSPNYQIPGKDYSTWIDTNPKDFNEKLLHLNKKNKFYIKKLIRIIKYWNVQNDCPFESYDIEKQVCMLNFEFLLLSGGQLKDYFSEFFKNFNNENLKTEKQIKAVKKAQKLVEEAMTFDKKEDPYSDFMSTLLSSCSFENPKVYSVNVIKKLLPPPKASFSADLITNY